MRWWSCTAHRPTLRAQFAKCLEIHSKRWSSDPEEASSSEKDDRARHNFHAGKWNLVLGGDFRAASGRFFGNREENVFQGNARKSRERCFLQLQGLFHREIVSLSVKSNIYWILFQLFSPPSDQERHRKRGVYA